MAAAGGGILHVKAIDENACAIQEGYCDCCAIRESMIIAARYRGAALVARAFAIMLAFCRVVNGGGTKRAGYAGCAWRSRERDTLAS